MQSVMPFLIFCACRVGFPTQPFKFEDNTSLVLPRLKEDVIQKYHIIRAPAFNAVPHLGRIAKGGSP